MPDFMKKPFVIFTISLVLGGITAALVAFAFFYLMYKQIGNFQSGWMTINLLVSAALLITIFAVVSKKIHVHLQKMMAKIGGIN